jgi:hypothetical protein
VAKTPKSSPARPGKGTDRRAVVDQLRSKQRKADRRRNFMIVGVSVVVALLIIGAAAFRPVKDWWDMRQFEDIELAALGAPASACGEITTEPATGNQQHVPDDTELEYPDGPPATGPHYDTWEPLSRKFYSPGDRPEVGHLLHNLEHGYTVMWYDETAADDPETMDQIRAIADKFEGDSDNYRLKFKAAPWLDSDGGDLPEGQHIAFTHWSVGGEGAEGTEDQQGVFQYCSEPSGEALESFMEEYPYTDSPEPRAS